VTNGYAPARTRAGAPAFPVPGTGPAASRVPGIGAATFPVPGTGVPVPGAGPAASALAFAGPGAAR